MKKTSVILLIMMLIMVFTPMVLADTEEPIIETPVVDTSHLENVAQNAVANTTVEPVSPNEGAARINAALLRVYQAGVGLVPNIALIALLIGIILVIFTAALGLERYLRLAIAGVFIIFAAVVVVYAAPLIMSMAVGIGASM